MSDNLIEQLEYLGRAAKDYDQEYMTSTDYEMIPAITKQAADEIKRLREYIVRQHDYFTGKDVPDLIVTTGTDYEDLQK
jgi:hypothetical protein